MALKFDADYYKAQRGDVYLAYLAVAGTPGAGSWPEFAEAHYNNHGWRELANPHPSFNTEDYLDMYPDIRDAGINPFQHFLNHGVNEGRAPSKTFPKLGAEFNAETYLNANPDLADADITTPEQAYAHFVLHGQFEGRPGTPAVDTGVPGKTINLTTAADGPAAAAPAVDTNGTANDDTYLGVFDASGASTFTTADIIRAGDGTDTVSVRVVSNATNGSTVAPDISGAEIFKVTNLHATANDFFNLNFASIEGEEEAWSVNSVANSTTAFTNVDAGTLIGFDGAEGKIQANFKGAAARTGTSDAFTVAVKGSNATFDTVNAALNTPDTSFEVANILASGAASTLSLNTGGSLRAINVTGDAAANAAGYGVTLSDAGASNLLASVDATGLKGSGGVSIDASSSTQTNFSFKGSGAADRVLVNGNLLNGANTISLSGGAGRDTLAVSMTTDFAAAGAATLRGTVNRATEFEVLEATAANVTALKADAFTGINEFLFSGIGAGTLAITGVETGDKFVFAANRAGAVNTNAVSLTGAIAGQSATIALSGNGVDLTTTGTGNAVSVGGGITALTIESTGAGTTANTIESATGVAAIANATAGNVTITGSHDLTIGATAGTANPIGFTNAVSVDASAFTGALRIAGSADADIIKGGSGNDIIYGRAGDDVLTGNGGADQFRFLASNEGTDKITDFTVGTDKIGISSGLINFANTTGTQAGAVLSAADYVDTRNDITNIAAADTLKVIELQSALTSAQIAAQVSSAGAAVNALVAVFNSDTGKAELWYDADWRDGGGRVQIATLDNISDLAGLQGLSATDFVEFVV